MKKRSIHKRSDIVIGNYVICVNDKTFNHIQQPRLTIGHRYKIVDLSEYTDEDKRCIWVIDDNGHKCPYYLYMFKPISKHREERLNEIGI